MVAIMCWMAEEEDWMPGAKLQVACKELRETREWLVAIQGKNVLLSPCKKMPLMQEPLGPLGSQRGELEVGNLGDKMGDEANDGKTYVLLQSEGKRGTKVLEADQVEHPLTGGQWEGLSTIRKGAEICVKVYVLAGHWRRDSAEAQDRAEWCSHP